MSLYRTVSEMYGDFSRKSQIFPLPVLKGFPLELVISASGQKLEWWGYQTVEKVFKIGLAV